MCPSYQVALEISKKANQPSKGDRHGCRRRSVRPQTIQENYQRNKAILSTT